MPKIASVRSLPSLRSDSYMVCAVHSEGVSTTHCLDFRLDPNKEPQEQWSPEGIAFYDGEPVGINQ